MPKALTKSEFIERARKLHGDKFDYSFSEYTGTRGTVVIICPFHGNFSQSVTSHLNGRGCAKCGASRRNNARKHTLESFITSANLIHSGKYSYDSVVYLNATSKVLITCETHGEWLQTPEAHLTGRGCPSCRITGFQPSRPGWIYVLKSGNITKIGITNFDPASRARRVSLSSKRSFKVELAIKFENGKVADILETKVLRYLRSTYTPVHEKFEGSSECFIDVDHNDLLAMLVGKCSEILNK